MYQNLQMGFFHNQQILSVNLPDPNTVAQIGIAINVFGLELKKKSIDQFLYAKEIKVCPWVYQRIIKSRTQNCKPFIKNRISRARTYDE